MEVFLTKLHAHARVCSACVYACTHRRTHKPTNTYGDYDLYTYIHTCVRSYTHSCMHTYIYVWCMRVQPESDTHRQADRQTGRQAGRQTDRHTHTHTERERERDRDAQTCTDRQTHTHSTKNTEQFQCASKPAIEGIQYAPSPEHRQISVRVVCGQIIYQVKHVVS